MACMTLYCHLRARGLLRNKQLISNYGVTAYDNMGLGADEYVTVGL